LKQFNIPIAGLEIGTHQYDFDIDGKFFEAFPESEIKNCRIKLDLNLIRQTELILLVFSIKGSIELICDRCLDPFDLDIDINEEVVLKYLPRNSKVEDKGEEVILPEQQEIDIRQYIYDFICLQIPFRKVHPDDENGNSLCDKEVLKKIDELSIKKDTDPRWDQLKDLEIN
jgi:uncharacterized metal-binding protein YceD (DUF177 family)